jgi:hypothetical protein
MDCPFWRGYHFKLGKSLLAIVRVHLQDENESDELALEEYMVSKRKPVSVIVAEVAAYFAGSEFYACRLESSAIDVKIVSEKNLAECMLACNDHREKFRGFPENGRIIFSGSPTLIAPQGFEGYVPSVQTSSVKYPNAVYRDGDLCDILVSSGTPVVTHGSTTPEEAYPVKFKKVSGFRPRQHCLWFAVTFTLKKVKPPTYRVIGWGFGAL